MESSGIFEGLKKLKNGFVDTFVKVYPEKIPIEEINEPRVAEVILKWLGNPNRIRYDL